MRDPNYEGTVLQHRSTVFVGGYDTDKWSYLEDIQLDHTTPLWSVITDQSHLYTYLL